MNIIWQCILMMVNKVLEIKFPLCAYSSRKEIIQSWINQRTILKIINSYFRLILRINIRIRNIFRIVIS